MKIDIVYDKPERRWTVVRNDEWLCDCATKEVAREIKEALEQVAIWKGLSE
jgi:hypothetical protein